MSAQGHSVHFSGTTIPLREECFLSFLPKEAALPPRLWSAGRSTQEERAGPDEAGLLQGPLSSRWGRRWLGWRPPGSLPLV